jgi:hypothetical protein
MNEAYVEENAVARGVSFYLVEKGKIPAMGLRIVHVIFMVLTILISLFVIPIYLTRLGHNVNSNKRSALFVGIFLDFHLIS